MISTVEDKNLVCITEKAGLIKHSFERLLKFILLNEMCISIKLTLVHIHNTLSQSVTVHFAQKTFRTSLLAQVLDRSHYS